MQSNQIQYKIIRSNIKNLYLQKKQKWINKSLQKSLQKREKQEPYTQEEFIQIIEENVKELIKLTNLKPNRVRIRKIQYAWGSCSSNKNITINHKLICYSKQAIRYVILHELCHLEYMNHSKEFWELVENYMPNYKEVRKELR